MQEINPSIPNIDPQIVKDDIQNKNYKNFNIVVTALKNDISLLKEIEKEALANYINDMSFQAIQELRENSKLLKTIQRIIQTARPLYSTITLEAKNKEKYEAIKANKVLLAAQSEYFLKLLFGDYKESKSSNIKLEDIPSTILDKLVRYSDTGEIDLNSDIEATLSYAGRFQLSGLQKRIEDHLISAIAEDKIEDSDLMTLWDNLVEEKANSSRILFFILLKITFKEIDNEWYERISLYLKNKYCSISQCIELFQNINFDLETNSLVINKKSINSLPLILSLFNADSLFLDLLNVSSSEVNQYFQKNPELGKSLLQLHLYSCPIDSTEISQIIQKYPNIKYLFLAYCDIDSNGAKILAQELKDKTTLKGIGIKSNKIRDEGAKALADALKSKMTLRYLTIVDESIGITGTNALMQAIKMKNNLEKLELGLKFDFTAASDLAEYIKRQKKLRKLYLPYSNISGENLKKIIEAHNENPNLGLFDDSYIHLYEDSRTIL